MQTNSQSQVSAIIRTQTPAVPHRVPDYRILHVVVPEDAHRAARVAAAQSGMFFKDFVIRLLRSADPIPPS
jgi:hypothetical protein